MLEKDIIRKGWEFLVPEIEPGDDNNEYKIEAIRDSAVYAKKEDGYLPGLYYLIEWKGYPEEENTWEPFSAVMHLQKMVSTFHKNYPEKPRVTSVPLDYVLLIAKPTIQLSTKRKRGRLICCAKKRPK